MQAENRWGYFLTWRYIPRLCFGCILLLAAALRISHLEIAHFGLDQSRTAQYVLDLVREGRFYSHYFLLTGGYNNFPLPLYLWAPPFVVSTHIHALLIWNILLSLVTVVLCWYFARRYWCWPVAALATLLLASSPWHSFYAHRIWSNVQMSPFVMLWLIGSAFAYHERRPRWWGLSWGAAILLVQIHASGAIFLFASGLLWLMAGREGRSWRWAGMGFLLAMIPALPWLAAHLSGEIGFHPERLPFIGEGKRALRYNLRPLFEMLTTKYWQSWFRGTDWAELEGIFRPLEILFVPMLLVYGISAIHVFRQSWRGGPRRRLNLIVAIWLLLPIFFFPFVSHELHSLVYYLPLLPAPFLALAVSWQRLRKRWRPVSLLAILFLCAVQARVVLGSAQYIRSAVESGDETVWAAGGYTPLSRQLAIAEAARETVESGEASEIIHLVHPIYTVEYETLTFALPLLSGMPTRILDQSAPHMVYPTAASVWFMDTQNTEWPAEYAEADEVARIGQYRLYLLPGGVGPAPENPLAERTGYANGIQLLGYGELQCNGNWQLHWTPGPAGEDGDPVHFFAHLLDEDGNVLAQREVRSYDYRYWRDGDHIITNFDFGPGVVGLPVEIVRIGLYSFLDEMDSKASGGNYILDERGRLWVYWNQAVDLPYREGCSL